MVTEWQCRLCREENGNIHAWLMEFEDAGTWRHVDEEDFGPFETATDVCQWLVRHWAPRAKLRLR